MGAQIAVGTGTLTVNGVRIPLADEMRIMGSPVKRESQPGIDGTIAMSESYQAVYVEATARDSREVDWPAIFRGEGVTVGVTLRNGTSWEMANAFYTGDSEINVKDGTVAARWDAQSIQRLT